MESSLPSGILMSGGSVMRNILELTIESEQEEDGRWIAEVLELPGVLVYGASEEKAITQTRALALHVLSERIEQGEIPFVH